MPTHSEPDTDRRRPRRPRTSPATSPTSCGSPTSPSTPPARARSTARSCSTLLPPRRRLVDRRHTRPPRWSPTRSAWRSSNRKPAARHGDPLRPGVQFTSWAFTERAKAPGWCRRWASVGDCYDNAMIESFWGRMQVELLDRNAGTPDRARQRDLRIPRDLPQPATPALRLGMLTPIEFEARQSPTTAA